MAALTLKFLGAFEITAADVPLARMRFEKARALLVYLAIEADRSHTRAHLAALFWPEQPANVALRNLSQTLIRMREAIGDRNAGAPFVLITRQTVQWNRDSDYELDVTTFTTLARSTALPDLHQADDLYRGELLTGFSLPDCDAFDEWLLLTREALQHQALAVLDRLANYALKAAEYGAAEAAARRQLALDLWRETAHRQLMQALAGAGDRAAALAQYATCRRILQKDLGVEPDAATTALYERIRHGDTLQHRDQPVDQAPLAPTLGHGDHRPNVRPAAQQLPIALTPLIGRAAELAELIALVGPQGERLINLIGAGGVGKTRLALELAVMVRHRYADDVLFVALATVRQCEGVIGAIAQALDVRETAEQTLVDRVADALHERQLLLVLDNFEQVVDAAPVLVRLLQAAPQVAMVVTSREALHVRGEYRVPVQPLPLPPAVLAGADRPPIADLEKNSAIALFVARARQAHPHFVLHPEYMPAVVGICRQLDGLPLAIELAAPHCRLLSPPNLLARLGHRLPVLEGTVRDLPERHQTMRSTIAWSYELLSPADQRLFRRLAVFVGGATLSAVDAVCSAPLQAIESLLDKSLLTQHEEPGWDEPRVMQLETIREYALELLSEAGEIEATRQQHADYFLTLAEREAQEHPQPTEQQLGELTRDHDNIRAALHCLVATHDTLKAARMVVALWAFWVTAGYYREGRWWFDVVLKQDEATLPDDLLAQVLFGAAWLAQLQSDVVRAAQLFAHSAELYQYVGNAARATNAQIYLGRALRLQGDYLQARRVEEESLAFARKLDDQSLTALALLSLGDLEYDQGNLMSAATHFEAARELFKALDDGENVGWTSKCLGEIAHAQGDVVRAEAFLEQSIAFFRAAGRPNGVAEAVLELARVVYTQGDMLRGADLYRESLRLNVEYGSQRDIAYTLEGMARLALTTARPEQAAQLLGAADRLRERATLSIPLIHRAEYDRVVAAVRDILGECLFTTAWSRGRTLSLEAAVALA